MTHAQLRLHGRPRETKTAETELRSARSRAAFAGTVADPADATGSRRGSGASRSTGAIRAAVACVAGSARGNFRGRAARLRVAFLIRFAAIEVALPTGVLVICFVRNRRSRLI
ncbi:MAG: hypothetical protein NXI24_23550 [bacterium]|nr:hypothetical protein [bacterium]